VTITASFGVATTTATGDVDDLLRRADDALLRAKAQGRNRVECDRP
jgi:PleD family two-component response regulator